MNIINERVNLHPFLLYGKCVGVVNALINFHTEFDFFSTSNNQKMHRIHFDCDRDSKSDRSEHRIYWSFDSNVKCKPINKIFTLFNGHLAFR